MTARYTGTIRQTPDGLRGELRDEWGWAIQLSGRTAVVDGVKVLELDGVLGETPVALRLPGETAMREPEPA